MKKVNENLQKQEMIREDFGNSSTFGGALNAAWSDAESKAFEQKKNEINFNKYHSK